MKKAIFSILTVLTVLALVMTGCPSPGGPSGTKYTVTFDANGGTGTAEKQVKAGERVSLPTTGFTRDGYNLSGWSETANGSALPGNSYTPEEDTTLYAVWTLKGAPPVLYTVSFDPGDGTGTAPAAITQTSANQGITLPADKGSMTGPEGKTYFIGWGATKTAATGLPSPYTPNGNVTLYALWSDEAAKYTVTFDGNGNTGGTVPTAVTQTTADEEITLPGAGDLVKTNSTFKGWSSDGKEPALAEGAKYKPVSNTTLKAVWETAGGGGGNTNEPNEGDFTSSETKEEIMYLENAAVAAYQFNIPAGSTLGDYDVISVDYSVDATWIGKPLRHARMYGALDPNTFMEDKNHVIYAPLTKYNETPNGIIADKGVSNGEAATGWMPKLGATAANTWFTVTYKLDASTKNSNFDPNNKPPEEATGTFYFGIGLPGAGDTKGNQSGPDINKGFIAKVRSVKMVPYADVTAPEVPGVVPVKIPQSDGTSLTVTNGQFFVSYSDPVVFSYRSQNSSNTITNNTIPKDPDYVAPDPQGPPAENDFDLLATLVTAPATTLKVGKDDAKLRIPITFPTGYNLSSYSTYTIAVKYYDTSGTDITESEVASAGKPGFGLGSVKFKINVAEADGANRLAVQWNLGMETKNAAVPSAAKERQLTFGGIHIEANHGNVAQIEITELKFFAPPTADKKYDKTTDAAIGWKGDWGLGSITSPQWEDFDFANQARIYFEIPAAVNAYKYVAIKLTYTNETNVKNVMKITMKKGDSSSTTISGGIGDITYDRWINQSSDGSAILAFPLAAFDLGKIAMEFNNDNSDDFTLTVDGVLFTNVKPTTYDKTNLPAIGWKGDWGLGSITSPQWENFDFANQARIYFEIPGAVSTSAFVTLKLTYTNETNVKNVMKITMKKGDSSSTTISGGIGDTSWLPSYDRWVNQDTDGERTLKFPLAAFDMGKIAMEYNNDNSDDFTLTVESVTFSQW